MVDKDKVERAKSSKTGPNGLPPALNHEIVLSDNARTVLERRYLRKDPKSGEPAETVEAMFWRVASHVAAAEEQMDGDSQAVAEQFYNLLTSKRFFPNSPTFTGAGTPLGQLAACFVLPISDDMGKEESGIFQTLRDAALVQQTGGGNGFAFSRLRPKGASISSSGGRATGPVGFLRVYDQAFGEVAQGGCLTVDTLVFTENGLLRLDEIVPTNQPGWRTHDLIVATDEGQRYSSHAYNNGTVPVLRMKTQDGIEVTGTPNHKFKVLSPDGLVWRKLKDILPGDSVLVKLGQHRGRLQTLKHPERQHGNQIMADLPAILDEEFAFFMGCMAGDGFVASSEKDHRVGISVAHDSYLIEEIPSLLRRLFGKQVNVHKQQKDGDASVTFVVDNRAVKDFLEINGLSKAKSSAVSVPRLVRQSPPEVVGAFLRGLFEADGSTLHGYPELRSVSETLIRETAILLIGLGCPIRIQQHPLREDRYGRNPIWSVRIVSHVGLQAWKTNIGCDARSRFIISRAFEPDLAREMAYALPSPAYWVNPVLAATQLAQIDGKGRGQGKNFRSTSPKLRKQLLRYVRGDRQLTRSGYTLLAETYDEFAEYAQPINNEWFVTVSSVEDAGEALTLDLEVEDNHTYLANGMTSHNTRRGANMAVLRGDHPDIRDFVTCKIDENQITNFNISVGATDAFMQAVEDDAEYDLVNPQDGEVWETVRAREIFDLTIKHAHHNGEPGILFLDAANRTNPVPHLYELEATNPCATGDTLVATPYGWKRVDSIQVGDEICTVLGTGRVANVEVHEALPVYAVYLSDGAVVKVTAAHQFHARDSRTKFFEAKRTDELKVGEWIRVFRSQLPDNDVPGKPEHLTDSEYGFVVGVLIGDGSYTPKGVPKNVVRVSTHADEDEWNTILEEALTNLGVERVVKYSYPGTRSMMMDPKPGRFMADFIRSIPLEPARSPDKTLPESFINSNEEFLVGLLDGLFSTDGSVDLASNHPLVRFHTSSKELAQQVRRILLMFGVHGRVFESRRKRHDIEGRVIRYDRPKYDVVISGSSFGRFMEQITLSHPAKQMRIEEAALRCNFTGGNWAAKVLNIEPAGIEKVYDLYEPKSDTWITEGYVSRGCGEQFLGPHENCCLGSINLAEHVTDEGQVDWDKLQESIQLSTRFLDDVVTANGYVPAVPQLAEAAHRVRRIGLGIMGLGDLMYHLGIRYGSRTGQEFAAQIMEFVQYHCMRTSINLSEARGPFPAIKGSLYDPDNLRWSPPEPLEPHRHDWSRPELDWDSVVSGIKEHGIRNGAQTTIAPTGTISTVAGCEAYGCEPVFALAYMRHFNDNGKDVHLQYTSPLFEKALIEAGLSEEERQRIVEQVMHTGTCHDIEELPEHIRHTFAVSADIKPGEHVRMQAALQAFVDNSISKTCNFPAHATEADVAEAYLDAWKLGCKGLTVYVTGSRDDVVLETAETAKSKQQQDQPETVPLFNESKKPRPASLPGTSHRIGTPAGTTYVTVNRNGDDEPFEVFIQTAKAGSETNAVSEAIGRLISYVLRLASPVRPTRRLEEIVRQLEGIGGGRPLGLGPNRVLSLPDGVAQALAQELGETPLEDETTAVATAVAPGQMSLFKIGDLCPECGEPAFVQEEGCRKCYACGFSEC